MLQRWPSRIWIVRHGESAGNVARDAAAEAGLAWIDIAERDVDVALSERGHRQAEALGRWFAEMPRGGHFAALEQPDLLVEDFRAAFRDLR